MTIDIIRTRKLEESTTERNTDEKSGWHTGFDSGPPCLDEQEKTTKNGVKFRENIRRESFGIPNSVINKLTIDKQSPSNRESVNWLRKGYFYQK